MTERCNTAVFASVTRELLERGCSVRFRPEGQSMGPTIRAGDQVTVVPTDGEQVGEGDLVLAGDSEQLILHRLVHITDPPPGERQSFVIRGDAAGACDQAFCHAQLLGRVETITRRGRARHFLRQLLSMTMRVLRRMRAASAGTFGRGVEGGGDQERP